MVDIHSHILPGVDDGAPTLDVALDMCRMAARDGIRHIVATPHANDEYQYDRPRFEALLADMQEQLGDTIRLSLGCDFHCSIENLEHLSESPGTYTISGTKYLLVEFSDYSVPPGLVRTVIHLLDKGLVPIVTHPERNMVMQRSPEMVLEFAEAGCIVQVTANSVTGYWGGQTKKLTRWLLEHEAVHVVATDCHNLKSRPPVLSEARKALAAMAGEELATALVELNPQAIVQNQLLPYLPYPTRS